MIVVFGDIHLREEEPHSTVNREFIHWSGNREWNSPDNIGIFVGDVFHKPKNSGQANYLAMMFIETLRFKKIFILRGNHDFNRRDGDALELFDGIERVEVIREPKRLDIEDQSCMFLPFLYPYINEFGERITMQSLYENSEFYPSTEFDFIFGHFGDETSGEFVQDVNISFLVGHRILGHVHNRMSKNFIGTPYITRFDEKSRKASYIGIIEKGVYREEEVPQLFEYITIKYGEVPMGNAPNGMIDIEDAPSREDALSKYSDYFIHSIRLLHQKQERTLAEDTISREVDVKKLFEEYVKTNKVSNPVKELIMGLL